MLGAVTIGERGKYHSRARKLLADYIQEHFDGSQVALARALAKVFPTSDYNIVWTQHKISFYLSGRTRPDLESAFMLQDFSKGAVPARSWIEAP